MSRRRRTPAPPGRVEIVCTGRGRHDPVKLRRLQLSVEGDRVRLYWDQRDGQAPETGFRAEDDWKTFEFACGTCRRHPKRREDWLVPAVLALAQQQGISGDDNTPVNLDISLIERA